MIHLPQQPQDFIAFFDKEAELVPELLGKPLRRLLQDSELALVDRVRPCFARSIRPACAGSLEARLDVAGSPHQPRITHAASGCVLERPEKRMAVLRQAASLVHLFDEEADAAPQRLKRRGLLHSAQRILLGQARAGECRRPGTCSGRLRPDVIVDATHELVHAPEPELRSVQQLRAELDEPEGERLGNYSGRATCLLRASLLLAQEDKGRLIQTGELPLDVSTHA
mmetsp:Transcript_18044/g.68427  ORF Transcript_18044/g.68427 Transcript_18044/m.68427 type:complete len:226 (-) Transcript_18044:670-1347(-)|eukprot:scaffold63_cov306-Pinguiococcus_pyrenoidosus.AAC.70